jgi:hypothetical protein
MNTLNLFCRKLSCYLFGLSSQLELKLNAGGILLMLLILAVPWGVASQVYCVEDFIFNSPHPNTVFQAGCDRISQQIQVKVSESSSACLSSDQQFDLILEFNDDFYDLESTSAFFFDGNGNPVNIASTWTETTPVGNARRQFTITVDLSTLTLSLPTHLLFYDVVYIPKRPILVGSTTSLEYWYSFSGQSTITRIDKWFGLGIQGRIISGSLADFNANDSRPAEAGDGIYVDGELIVDTSASLGMDITGSPGFKITVTTDNATFFGNLYGCEAMWEGITIEADGRAFVFGSIKDAETAVNIEAGGLADVNFATLSQNVIGVNNSGELHCIESQITTDENADWLSFYPGQSLFPVSNRGHLAIRNNDGSFASISRLDASGTLGGLDNFNSTVNIDGSTLDDFLAAGGFDFSGVGINQDGDFMTAYTHIRDFPSTNNIPTTFENMDIGLRVRGGNFDLERSEMSNLNVGVDMQDTRTGGQSIFSNQITSRNYGIQILNSYPNKTEIKANDIEIAPGGSEVGERACIRLESNRASVRVLDNIMTLGSAEHGIRSTSNFLPLYRNNSATMNPTSSLYGYRSSSEFAPRYFCNTAQNGGQNVNTKGFSWANATSYVIQCNEAFGQSDGFNFNLSNTGESRFRGNDCDGQQPLVVENGATMSQQMHTGNCFSGGLTWNQNADLSDVRASQFTAEDGNSGLTCDLFPDNRVPVSDDWFEDEGGALAYACSSSPGCPSGTGSSFDPCNSPAYVDHILNPLSLVDPAQQYYLELQIMIELEESGCDSLALTLDTFVNSQSGTVREAVKDIILDLPQLSSTYQDHQDSVVLWLQERSGMIETLIEMKLDEEADPMAITNLETQIAAITQQILAASTQMTNEYNSAVTSLQTALNSASAPGLHDARLKTVFTRLLEYAQGTQSTWTAADIDDLEAIAELCPFEGNIATFVARGLLSSVAPATYDDTALCQGGDLRQAPNAQVKSLGDEVDLLGMTITPNPAFSHVNIVLDESLLNGNITLVNAFGQTVIRQSIKEVKAVILDISAIGPGWYQVLIDNEGQILAREKLLIVHD